MDNYSLETANAKGDVITSADVSYDFQVGLRISECSNNQSRGTSTAFFRSVESLQSILKPYVDETYKKAVEVEAKRLASQTESIHSLERNKRMGSIRYAFMRAKFELLLELADRKNFLAKKGVRQ